MLAVLRPCPVEETIGVYRRRRNGVSPRFLPVDEKPVVEHTLIAMVIVLDFDRTEFEIAIRDVSKFPISTPQANKV